MSLEIHRATMRDLTKVVGYYGPIGDSPLDPFSSVERLRKLDLKHLLVAEQHGTFAGFLYYFIHRRPWFDPNVDRYASIVELHVLPDHRGRGIGTRLLLEAFRKIKKEGVKVVYVDTGEDNTTALHVYRKAGFRKYRKTVKLKLILSSRSRPKTPLSRDPPS